MADVEPPQSLTEAMHHQTQGNPLFITEVVKMLVREGRLTGESVEYHPGLDWGIPEGVREAIGRRLHRLSSECNQVMTVASVVGREFRLELLELLLPGFSAERLLEVLEEGLSAGIIEELASQVGRYRFTHVLIQETLAQGVSSARRGQWHAEIGQALEELYGARAEVHAAELAYHFSQAVPFLGPDKLIHYSVLAGEQALATYAYEEALEHFQRGLEAREGRPADAQAAALLFGLGRAQFATLESYKYHEALTNLNQAFNHYAEVGDVDGVVAIAVYPFYPLIGQHTGVSQLIARALSLVPPESHAAGQLLSRYGRIVGIEEGDYKRAGEAFARALSIAQLEGDVALEIRILADAANVDMLFCQHRESLAKSKRAIELAHSVDEPVAEALARYSSVLDQLALGNLPGMQHQASALLASAERLRDRFWLTMALRANEDVAHLVGDWESARGFSDRGLQMSPTECRNLCTRTILEFQAGDFGLGETYLRRLVEVMRLAPPGPTNQHAFTAMAIPLVTRISGCTDFLEIAEAAAETVLSSRSRIGHMEVFARVGLALLATCGSDARAAQEQYTFLKVQQGTMVPFAMVSADRVLGLLAHTMGRLEQAAAHFEEALAFCRRAGCRPELAWTCHDYAETLLRRNAPGDHARATSLLGESLGISTELGMCPLMERVTSLQEQAQSQLPRAPAYPAGLTHREVEVLRLVAAGKSSAEIAAELVLSRRTVERHISNIYSKTNCHSRSEVTAFAFTQGLMSSN